MRRFSGLYKLKAKKRKKFKVEIVYIAALRSFNTLNPHLLPLANSFNFNFFFNIT